MTARTERRTQQERSNSMRKRLIKATVESLAEDGYAGSTLSKIVRRAGVSRGAQVHHYASKNALILDAGMYLLARSYRLLGEVLLNIADGEDRLRALVFAAWEVIYKQPSSYAFMEVLVASQHEDRLRSTLKELNQQIVEAMSGPIDHYFERRHHDSEAPTDMFRAMVIFMAGLGSSRLLMQETEADQQIEFWYRLMRQHIKARKGVNQPPPVPPKLNIRLR